MEARKLEQPALVKSKSGEIYIYKGEDDGWYEFENLSKGRSGHLTLQQCQDTFSIPLGLIELAIVNPDIINLIRELKMTM